VTKKYAAVVDGKRVELDFCGTGVSPISRPGEGDSDMFQLPFKPLFDLNSLLAASSDVFKVLPHLTCAGGVIAVACWGIYMVTGRKDFLVLSVCAIGYAIVPLM
jgi:hypothetical protein